MNYVKAWKRIYLLDLLEGRWPEDLSIYSPHMNRDIYANQMSGVTYSSPNHTKRNLEKAPVFQFLYCITDHPKTYWLKITVMIYSFMVSVGQKRFVFAPKHLSGVLAGRRRGCGWNHWKTQSSLLAVSWGHCFHSIRVVTVHDLVWASSQHGGWVPRASIPSKESHTDAIFFYHLALAVR